MEMIRKATKQDVDRIAEIIVFNYRLYFYPIFKNDEFYFKDMQVTSVADKYMANKEMLHSTFVYDDGTVKGMICVSNGEVKKLFVEPVLQNLGIGENLLEYAIEHCHVKFLWALEKNKRAIKFYQKHGFHLTNEKILEDETTEFLVRLNL